MPLRARLLLLIVALVTLVVAALSLLYLNGLVETWSSDVLERSELAGQQVKSFLVQRIQERTQALPAQPATVEETKRLWTEMVAADEELKSMLVETLAHSRFLVEILIASEDGRVLASSNPVRATVTMTPRPAFSRWRDLGPLTRLEEVLSNRKDYEVTIPLGLPSQKRPIFVIQVVVSSVLLRQALLPQLQVLGAVSLASLLLAILLGVFMANVALRPLREIGQTIDRIRAGEPLAPAGKPPLTQTREFALVEDKLEMLGQQYRGAREDAMQLRSNIEQLLDRLEEAVLLFDAGGKLVMASSSAERMLGRKQAAGHSIAEIFPPATPLGALVERALRQGEALKNQTATIDLPGAAPRRLLVTVEPVQEKAGALVSLRDAETRRQLASQLDVSSRLAAISRLTSGVAHEIKNPLNAITLRLELLRGRLEEDHPDAQEEIAVISREIKRLDRVVKTFLDFTRPVDLVLEPVDLAPLVRDVAALVSPQAGAQKVSIKVDTPPGPCLIGGDRDLLKQAVLNVVMNGIEAMKGGGDLALRLQRLGGHCLLEVEDHGTGIPPELHNRVFQLYFTTKEKGSGIGLAMAFRAVQLHNGTIDFSSEPGKGTTFRLRFPLEVAALEGRR